MSYTRQSIEQLINRYKKPKSKQKSTSPPLLKKSSKLDRSNSPKDMNLRYQELLSKYRSLLEQVKDRDHIYELQQNELIRLKQQKERDQKQLYRLRSMIGFIKKQDIGVQVCMDMHSGGSWATKVQKQTAVEDKQDLDFSILGKYNQSPKIGRKKSPTNRQMNHTFNNISNPTKTANMQDKNRRYQKYNLDDRYEQCIEDKIDRFRTQSFYSPKNIESKTNQYFKTRQSRQINSTLNKLSNSPYSKLKFSRNINKN